MTVQEIVKDWLTAHGYDGLAGDECGCGVDDLAPCGFCNLDECKAAHKRVADNDDAVMYMCMVGDVIYVAEEDEK